LHLSQQATFLTRNQGFEAYLTAENRVNDIGARSELMILVQDLSDPNIGDFQLDPPWNELSSLSLRGLELEINLTRKIGIRTGGNTGKVSQAGVNLVG